jgi:hypothetical protein
MALHLTSCVSHDTIAPPSELREIARLLERGELVIGTRPSGRCASPFCIGASDGNLIGPRETAAVIAVLRSVA